MNRNPTRKPRSAARLLSVTQVVEQLGVDRQVVYKLINAGRLRVINIGTNPEGRNTWRIPVNSLEQFLQEKW